MSDSQSVVGRQRLYLPTVGVHEELLKLPGHVSTAQAQFITDDELTLVLSMEGSMLGAGRPSMVLKEKEDGFKPATWLDELEQIQSVFFLGVLLVSTLAELEAEQHQTRGPEPSLPLTHLGEDPYHGLRGACHSLPAAPSLKGAKIPGSGLSSFETLFLKIKRAWGIAQSSIPSTGEKEKIQQRKLLSLRGT